MQNFTPPTSSFVDETTSTLLKLQDWNKTSLEAITCDLQNADAKANSDSRKSPSLSNISRSPYLPRENATPRESHTLSERLCRQVSFATPESASKLLCTSLHPLLMPHKSDNVMPLEGDLEIKLSPMPEQKDSGSQKPGQEPAMESILTPEVFLTISGGDAFIAMYASKGLLSKALTVLEQHKLSVVDGNITSNGCTSLYHFEVKVSPGHIVSEHELQSALQSLACCGDKRLVTS